MSKQQNDKIKKEKTINIILSGNPLSNQHIYKPSCIGGRPRLYMTKEGKERKLQYQLEARNQYKGEPLEGDLKMEVGLFFRDARRRDVDNFHRIC